MGWFSKETERKPVVKENIWVRCEKCNAHVFKEDWLSSLKVCPKCGFHDALTAYERIEFTCDEGTFREFGEGISPADPLAFVDGKGPYTEKVAAAREKSGLNEAVVTGSGRIEGIKVSLSVMDFRFLGGSLGSGTGEKILLASEYAYSHRIPYIIFSASGGARMHEGILSLMQMAKTCAGIARLNDKRVPYISVMTHPTTGGVSASYASVGDINLAEPGALIGFAGRRVIEQTIKQKLPPDFQTAEFLLKHGFVDSIVHRKDLKRTLALILKYATESR
jgi:acetyl-CoA carboxylase carboxyl transferase subunit beta